MPLLKIEVNSSEICFSSPFQLDPSITRLVDKLTWYVIPVLNPDGYECSFFCLIRSFNYASGGQVDLVRDSCFEPGWLRIFSHDKPNVEKDA